jgi:hypothetical protein
MTLLYMLIAWTLIVGFVSFGVDLGRVQSAKTKLFVAADAAARYATTGLGDGTAVAKAIAAAQSNSADGSPVVLLASDVEIGVWDTASRTFTATNISPNAVRVSARRTSARGNAIPTTFCALFGCQNIDINAVSVAQTTTATATTNTVVGLANPWLAGMPDGTTANWYDSAPSNSPVAFQGVTITPGATLNISFTGSISNGPQYQSFGPDGDSTRMRDNNWATQNGGSEHGIANLQAPICSMVGVFLDDRQPDSSPAPPALDFSTDISRDFATLSPLLKQPFFIGDGFRADGTTKQSFIVPAGATRLYVGIMDGFQWSNNSGTMSTTVVNPALISTVK